MTTARDTDRLHESFARLEERRAGDALWLRDLRREALARFEMLGFPTTKTDGWRQTSVARIASVAWTPTVEAAVPATGLGRILAPAASGTRLVFVNGAFSRELSTLRQDPAVVTTLREALAGERAALVHAHLGRHAREGTAFSALNTVFLEDGALVHVPEGVVVAEPIEIVAVATAPDARLAVNGRVLIVLGAGARATVLERWLAPHDDVYFANAVTEVVLGRGASLDHTRLELESERAFRVALLAVQQERESRYAARTITLGGALVREDARLVLGGEGAECALDGLVVLGGEQHADHHTTIEHATPRCRSRQEHRSIVADRSRSVFNGRIVVRPDAQRTVAEQSSRNLLLSDDATADASPELEIHADDVKCAHGATVGRLSEDALFYMRSRGIDPGAARAVLTYAFASEVVGRTSAEPVRALLEDAVRARLCPGERHLRALERARKVTP